VVFVGWWGLLQLRDAPTTTQQQRRELVNTNDRQLVTARLGDKLLSLEVVNTPPSIAQGLSGRDRIGSDGMLFVMPQAAYHQFWMIGMRFNLDMIWLLDSQVVDITLNVPRPSLGQPPASLPKFRPSQPADMVLEVGEGQAAEWDISVGDRLAVQTVRMGL